MAADTATDLRIERKPKLSERVVVGAARADARRRDRAGPEAADREPADRDLRRQPHGRPRGDRHAGRRRAGRAAAGRRRLRRSTIRRSPSARSASRSAARSRRRSTCSKCAWASRSKAPGWPRMRRNAAQEARDPGGVLRVRAAAATPASRPARPISPSTAPSPRPPTIRSMSRCSTRSAAAPSPATSPRPGAPKACCRANISAGCSASIWSILKAISAGDADAARDADARASVGQPAALPQRG